MYSAVSKRQERVSLQCMRAVHLVQTIARPPNLLHLTFVARLCRISGLQQPSVSPAKLIKRVLQWSSWVVDGMRVAGDLQRP